MRRRICDAEKAGYADRNRPSVENGQAVSISREALTIKRSGNG